jgi:serine/threonine protein kinase
LEVCLLKQLAHVPGVIKLLDYYDRSDCCIIIMERPDQAKDLFDYITEKICLKESVARGFFRQVVETVIQCHNAGVIHRDIKVSAGHFMLVLERVYTYAEMFGVQRIFLLGSMRNLIIM